MKSKKADPKVKDSKKRVWKSQRREVIRRTVGVVLGGAVAGPIGAVVGAIASGAHHDETATTIRSPKKKAAAKKSPAPRPTRRNRLATMPKGAPFIP